MAEAYEGWWQRRGRTGLVDQRGKRISDARSRERVAKLRIPPAWTDVRISPRADTKLQAVGLDAKGRRQYIYHQDWVQSQAEQKYARLVDFGRALPGYRERTTAALQGEGPTRERVLALVLRLIDRGCFRIGGERYARDNKSYGISTLCNRHLSIGETCLVFTYRGKRGVLQRRIVADAELVAVMREVAALPGKRLFQYRRADGTVAGVTGRELNAYIKELLGPAASAKAFRTWHGTLMAARVLAGYGPRETATARKRVVVNAVRAVSRYLGNTPAIARASYISPKVLAAYEAGLTLADFLPRKPQALKLLEAGHTPEEVELMRLLGSPRLTITMLPAEVATRT